MDGFYHVDQAMDTSPKDPYVISLIYSVVALFLLIPPQEVRSAGLTLERIFQNQLGSESLDFVGYHMRRTTLTRLVALLVPFGYFAILSLYRPDLLKVTFVYTGLLVSLAVAVLAIAFSLYYWRTKWASHPLARTLAKHGDNWRFVAGNINTEFRRIDKFTTGPTSGRVIVTESWLIKVGIFTVHVSKLSETVLALQNSALISNAQADVLQSVQRLSIKVTSANTAVGDFMIHVPGLEYRDFRSRLPFVHVVNVRGVTVQQTVGEQFVAAFIEQADRNNIYRLDPNTELDSCLGCMVARPDAKLVKLCAADEDGDCRNCRCRPQWCLSCMARWFASRQDQHRPETWLSSSAPCPNCRSRFCMLDVCRVVEDTAR
ncbi:E3 ubiquitin-protein ligase TM129-like [Sycon ciliatum]|uniref:E3 ubiquitin-protein ligase TM129-like n=1 Tax=Sycon ciliatum TaxID=27933 RepID=UPI0020A914DC|eukprot:scpid72427/ scgid35095/ Transmembrane protein 129